MVEDRITDGRRIAQLLASEIEGRADGGLDRLAVVDADRNADPSAGGTLAYRVERDGTTLAAVYVHPDGARITVETDPAIAAAVGRETGLEARPDDGRTHLLVESGAASKRGADALSALARRTD
ncbi:hypothetical protein BRD17_02920 [Halobacteriales archaeon SW_7_68_16]|nr:MAG: hypothetical protein BRD17_02920 [Halobacteriales archaeon SW_7_68_16]